MPDFFRGRKWDLVGQRNLWFAISFVIILPGVVAYFTKGLLEEATDSFRRALEFNPRDDVARRFLKYSEIAKKNI